MHPTTRMKKLAKGVFPCASAIRWTQPRDPPSLETSHPRREGECWAEGDSQRSCDREACRNFAALESTRVALQRIGAWSHHLLARGSW